MIFERDLIAFELLDVFYLNQRNVKNFNFERNIDALSFRINSDCVFETKDSTYKLSDNSVSFVPAKVDYTRIAERDELIVIHLNILNYTSREIEVIIPENNQKIRTLFKKVLEMWQTTKNKHACSALIYEIFNELYQEKSEPLPYNPKIQGAVDYINKHFADIDLILSDAAEKSFMTEVYFRKLFKQSFGTSPKKHIVNLRIKRAQTLIETGYYSLQEVCLLSGFSDYKYFSVVFKKATGVSPSKY